MLPVQNKDKIFVIASAAMILPAAFLFFVVSDLPHVFIITLIGFIISLSITSTLKYSDRSIIYSVLIALILAVVFNMIFPMKQERFFSIGKLFMSQVTVPLILYLAAIATFYESTPYTLGFNAAFGIIVIMLGGDFRKSTPLDENSMFAYLLESKQFNIFFLTIVVTDTLAMLFAFNLARKSLFHKKSQKFDWSKKIVITVAIIIASTLAISMFSFVKAYKNDIKKLENYLASLRRMRGIPSSNVLFDKEIDLNRTINSDLRKNSRQIMIRAEGNRAPGYLRGLSYQYYNNGKWREAQDSPKQMKFKINIEGLAFNAFYIDKDPGRSGEKFEIYPTSQCISKYLFYPANTNRFEIVADRLTYTKNGHITPKSWEKDGGYTTYISSTNREPAYPMPTQVQMKNYMQIPKDLSAIIAKTADVISENLPKNAEKQTDKLITNHVILYFANNYTYSLDPEAPKKGVDPVYHFMNNAKKGHCELFATSAAMLLRYYGIPTRYVTGFICDEPHPSGKYYIARLGNAHAWCEAYLRDEKRWILVDTTPASGSNPFGHKWGIFEVWVDRLKQAAQKMFADVRRGYIARAILAFLVEIAVLFWEIFWHPVRGVILTICTLFLIWFIKYYRKRKYGKKLQLEKKILLIQKDFNVLLTYIEKRTGINKKSSETTLEWIKQIQKNKKFSQEHRQFADFAKIIRQYQQLRFSTATFQENDIIDLKKSIKQFIN